jgi:hypothetical protein
MAHTPTDEQVAITDAAKTGENVKVIARAGTGKTTILNGIGHEMPDAKILYLAYNKAIQLEAESKFPRNVTCKTAHSLAYRAVGKNFAKRLRGPRVTSRQACGVMGIYDSFPISVELTLEPWQIARLAMDAVKKFCYSADTEITARHLPWMPGTENVRDDLADIVIPYARRAWQNLVDPNAAGLRFEHDHYLKMWALTNPRLPFDQVQFDESQDANGCIDGVVRSQDAQKIYVGDPAQSIYGWRGAIDAMSRFNAEHELTLSQSFRFGPAVAEEGNKFLSVIDDGGPMVSGFDQIDSQVMHLDAPDAILARTNATVVAEALHAQQDDRKVAIVGGTREIAAFADAAEALMQGRKTAHADLAAFDSWHAVQQYVNGDEGGDIKVMVKLIDTYGVQTVRDVADAAVPEEDADLIVSTAHKSKGREWHKVRVANDFNEPDPDKGVSIPEAMLAYVTVTRAQYVLDNSGLDWIDTYLDEQAA